MGIQRYNNDPYVREKLAFPARLGRLTKGNALLS